LTSKKSSDKSKPVTANEAPSPHLKGKSDAWKKGYAARSKVLGKDYVDKAFADADAFSIDLQHYLTEHAWGASWARPGLDFKTRSMLNLAMITALNRPHEFAIHVRGALSNGLTREQIKEILLHATVYCGAPAGIDAFRVARAVFAELDKTLGTE
jgi:4-carboxymuconolactone decarboxylase